MSTRTFEERPLLNGLGRARTVNWLKPGWKTLVGLKKKLIMGGVAVAMMGVGAFYYWGRQGSAAQNMTARVERGNLRNTVTATGTLQAVTTVQVGSQASGTISALYADFNSKVKKGQVIAQLDPAVTKAQVDQAQANLQQAQASVQQARAAVANSSAALSDAKAKDLAARSTAQNNQAGVSGAQANLAVLKAQQDDALSYLRQQESLLKSGVIAQSQAQVEQAQAQVQQSQAQVQQAQAQVQQAEAALRLAEVNLAHTTITSPIDGIVVSRDVNVGQTVAASLSAPTVFTIANDLTQMQVMANIDQADIGLVEHAKAVKFSVDAFPGKEFEGKIQQMRLNPQNVQNVVTYNVVIDVSNPEQKLKPGMTANLTITIDERNNVLKVPNAALRFIPQNATGQNSGGATAGATGKTKPAAQQGSDGGVRLAAPTAPVLEGQTRLIWVLGQDGKLQSRRIKVGLNDGAATEVVEGDLKEGEMVVTGQTITSASKPQSSQSPAPGFGGAPRTGGGRGN